MINESGDDKMMRIYICEGSDGGGWTDAFMSLSSRSSHQSGTVFPEGLAFHRTD